ncbi:MAG: hypothetical protein K2Y37_03865 [Pirellulales bacterium]|nr:hypothetical protein [Pirellulales bacterium]
MTLNHSHKRCGRWIALGAGLAVALLAWAPSPAGADDGLIDPLAKQPTLAAPAPTVVRELALQWLELQGPSDEVRSAALALWADVAEAARNAPAAEDHLGAAEDRRPPSLAASMLLERLAATFALVDERAAALVDLCSKPRPLAPLNEQTWLFDPETPSLVSNNLRLLYGRWLAQESLYDEARGQLAELGPHLVVDPATLLFYQGVVFHRLLEKEPGLRALERLDHDVLNPPERYRALAGILVQDLRELKDDSLDHIARRMGDIRRRLGLGRPGPKTREVEDGVIASLDKMIEELEEQARQQQQQQQQSQGGGGAAPSSPAPDSGIFGGSGRGETNRRDLGNTDGWGELPPKERQEAMQQIGKDFPAHYRDVVEQFFRKLAGESAGEGE